MHYFIQLLANNRMEFVDSIFNEVDTNPLLELDQPESSTPDPEVNNMEKRLERADSSYVQQYIDQGFFKKDSDDLDRNKVIESMTPFQETLQDHLLQQAMVSFSSEREMEIARQIIYNLDSGGYLKIEIESISTQLQSDPQEIDRIRETVKTFDPPGCACRTLQECLLAQLDEEKNHGKLRLLIQNHLDDLSRSKYDQIARILATSVDEVLVLLGELRRLNPRPGEKFDQEDIEYAEVDLMLIKEKNEYRIAYIEEGLPRLVLSQYYQEMLGKTTDRKTISYLKERHRDAQFFIDSIELRKNTIVRIAEYLIRAQRDYLDFGDKWKKPLTMKDVAQAVGLNESTISRAVNNKFMATETGLLSLRSFFSYGIKGDFGFMHSVETIKDKICEIIRGEPPEAPFSDDEVAARLENLGIRIARRTVRNYREEMNISSSFIRKKENKIKGAKP